MSARGARAGMRWALAAAGLLAVGGRAAGAQRPPSRTPVPELRLDGVLARDGGALAGVGLFGDAGLYARVGLVASAGAMRERGPGGDVVPAARLEGVARFHVDPLRQTSRGLYAGGGVAAAVRRGAPPAWQLVALLGVEGRPRAGAAPALEVGLGGGVRLAVVLRRARPGRR